MLHIRKLPTLMMAGCMGVTAGLAATAAAAVDPVSGLARGDSSSFTYKYEMDVNPRDPGQIDLDSNGISDFLAATGPTTFNSGVVGATDGDAAVLDATRPGANQILTGQGGGSTWDTAGLSASAGYTIEVRLKVDSIDTDNKALGINLDAGIGDGTAAWLNILASGQTWDNTGSTSLGSQDNTDAFHTFRIAYRNSDGTTPEYWVWRDDVLLNPGGTALGAGYTGTLTRSFLGAPSNDWGGVADLDYFRFTGQALAPSAVPEPASLSLIGIGSLLALRRRRR